MLTLPKSKITGANALFSAIHFENNAIDDGTTRLHKVKRIVEKVVETFKQAKQPEENLVIDKTMVNYQERLRFRQYNLGKAHKYGIKILK